MSLSQYYRGREGGDGNQTNAETEGAESGSPTSSSSSTDLSPAAKWLASQAVNYGVSQSPLSSIPGASGVVSSGVNTALSGGSAKQVGGSVISSGVASLLANAFPGVQALPAIGGALTSEAFAENPDYSVAATKAGVSSLGAMVGSMAIPVPVLGAMIGSTAANALGEKSLEEGYLGDWNDVREREIARDSVESYGASVGETSDMAARDKAMGGYEREDGYGFGLSANYGATTQGQMSKAAGDALGAEKESNKLSSYYSERMSAIMGREEKTNQESSNNSSDSRGGGDSDDGDGRSYGERGSSGHVSGGGYGGDMEGQDDGYGSSGSSGDVGGGGYGGDLW